jgi:predicted lipoprotein with Yx(FWY)xxD motif
MTTRRTLMRRGAGTVFLTLTLVAFALPAGAALKSEHVVKVERVAALGRVLFSEKGFALYTYAKDTKDHSKCDGACLSAWPALTVAKNVKPTGVAGLGVMMRSDGAHQVTWHGHPLYLFTSDTRKGVVTGNGVAGFHAAVLEKTTTKSTTTVKSYGY